MNRKKLIEHINKQAVEEPDQPEFEPFVKGTVRGKKWVPPPRDTRELEAEEQIAIDMGEEYEQALSDATQEEIIDLAGMHIFLILFCKGLKQFLNHNIFRFLCDYSYSWFPLHDEPRSIPCFIAEQRTTRWFGLGWHYQVNERKIVSNGPTK